MDIKNLIIKEIKRKKYIKVAEIIKATGFSRTYINRFFQQLREEGKIILIGKTNQARYILAVKNQLKIEKKKISRIKRKLKNHNLSEDIVLNQIKNETGIFIDLPKNIISILDYSFSEMLNNAIEHSQSNEIEIEMKRDKDNIQFIIIDKGIGIFKNIMGKMNLKNELEAIQNLLKGKETTAPKEHSGEGIFFTSKIADSFLIQSGEKSLHFYNILDDIFINNIKLKIGTRIVFNISAYSKKNISNIFGQYTNDFYEFDKTKVLVKLYKINQYYMSRSQARRILINLEKFSVIILDFKGVKIIGQAFADEIFRVWQIKNPKIVIKYENANKNVIFMIRRALAKLNK